MRIRLFANDSALVLLAGLFCSPVNAGESPWPRHTIDASSRGADGARPLDANGDGRLDLATGWEEGGVIRAYLHPGSDRVSKAWPAVTVGRVKSPEDAVFVDLDNDGATDVVSSCEGGTQTVFFHWAPKGRGRWLKEDAWQTVAVPVTVKKQRWMFALPLDVDGRNGIDLIVGSKNPNAAIGWLESPEDPRDVAAWRYHQIRPAGWIMSLVARDIDRDGDLDVVASDRKGSRRGVFWLQNPGTDANRNAAAWKEHSIGGQKAEPMFLDVVDQNATGKRQSLAVVFSSRQPAFAETIPLNDPLRTTMLPAGEKSLRIGTPKSVRMADLNLDGRLDLVMSCENAVDEKSGVVWFDGAGKPFPASRREISGPEGVKFDLIELIDLDNDGDLDVVTCEERANLGVIWYENPTRSRNQ